MANSTSSSLEDAQHAQLVEIATVCGEVFKDSFYSVLDGRPDQAAQFFKANSLVVWNGNARIGLEHIVTLFTSLPAAKHQITSFDSQPIPVVDPTQPNYPSMLVTVVGNVTYGTAPTLHHFRHTFVLEKDASEGQYYCIVSFTCRSHDSGQRHDQGVTTGFKTTGPKGGRGGNNSRRGRGDRGGGRFFG